VIDFVRYRKWFYGLSLLITLVAIIALAVPKRLPFGLEFSSGSSITIDFEQPVEIDQVRQKLSSIGITEATIQKTGDTSFFIRTEIIEEGLAAILEKDFGKVTITSLEDDAANLALNITFTDAVPLRDLREGFGAAQPAGLITERAGGNAYFVSALELSKDILDKAAALWEQKYGPIERITFETADDLAVTLKFKSSVTAADAGKELTDRGIQAVVTANTAPDTLIVAARGANAQTRETVLKTLTDKFGEAEQNPFPFDKGQALVVRFTDPVPLEKVVSALGAARLSDLAGSSITVFRLSDGSYLTSSPTMTEDEAVALVKKFEESLGAVTRVNLTAEDLALSINFGAPFTIDAARQHVNRFGAGKGFVEPFGTKGQAVSIFVEDISDTDRDGLLTALKESFGEANRTAFDGPEGFASTFRFTAPPSTVTVADVASELSSGGVQGATVIAAGENRFFIGIAAIDAGAKELTTQRLQGRFGPAEVKAVDLKTSLALTFEYGEPSVLRNNLIGSIEDVFSAKAVSVVQTDTNAFSLVARGVSAADQDKILKQLEGEFGAAAKTPFVTDAGKAFTIALTDSAKVAAAAQESFIIHKTGPNAFFLGGTHVSAAQQGAGLTGLAQAYGPITQSGFNYVTNIAQQLAFARAVTPDELKASIEPFGYKDMTIEARVGGLFIRGPRPLDDQRSTILRTLGELAPVKLDSVEFSSVDSEIAKRSIVNTFIAVIAGVGGILIFLWWAFRKVPKSYRYGFVSTIGMVHDVTIVLGTFGILAKFTSVEINSLFVVGVLSVVGYSVNNTITVLDRIRENLVDKTARDFDTYVNIALNQTLTRNLNTTITITITILAVLLFGGPTVRDFMLVLLIGVLGGAYSSIFIAPTLLVSWEKGELKIPFFSKKKPARQKA
jgi:preprotein translocase subunit SecF